MKNLNVTLKCHGGQVKWWDGVGPGGAKQWLFTSHHVSAQWAVYY